MIWIEHRPGENIPKELHYPGYPTDKDKNDQTPLMLWIRYRYDETIPE